MLVLKEKVPPRCMLATFFIVVGNVILVVFGNKDSPEYSVAELAALYRKDGMAAYMAMAYAGGKHLCLHLHWHLYLHLNLHFHLHLHLLLESAECPIDALIGLQGQVCCVCLHV